MRVLAVFCAASMLASAQDIPPDTLLLAHIRAHMADQLRRQPNYTCLETVERSEGASHRKLHDIDTLRLEVALVDGKEMFSWPGAKDFEDFDLRRIVRQGAMSNGDFALHARAIFTTSVATFEFKGEQDGLERFDFRVPAFLSGYTLRVPDRAAVVPYHGFFLADPHNFDLRRLEVIADDIPEKLGIAAAIHRMEYARIPIGGSNFLLPSEGELIMIDRSGDEHRNRTSFAACREFSGESVLRFDDEPESNATVRTEDIVLPENSAMELSLQSDLDTSRAAIGDPVLARLQNDIKEKGRLLFAKGATVLGRITGLEHQGDSTTIGLSFSEIEAGPVHGRFTATLERVAQNWISVQRAGDGEGVLVLHGGSRRVGRGILMFWRTGKS